MDTGLSLSDQVTLDKHYDCYLTAISSVYQMIFKKTDFKYLFLHNMYFDYSNLFDNLFKNIILYPSKLPSEIFINSSKVLKFLSYEKKDIPMFLHTMLTDSIAIVKANLEKISWINEEERLPLHHAFSIKKLSQNQFLIIDLHMKNVPEGIIVSKYEIENAAYLIQEIHFESCEKKSMSFFIDYFIKTAYTYFDVKYEDRINNAFVDIINCDFDKEFQLQSDNYILIPVVRKVKEYIDTWFCFSQFLIQIGEDYRLNLNDYVQMCLDISKAWSKINMLLLAQYKTKKSYITKGEFAQKFLILMEKSKLLLKNIKELMEETYEY
jgi:hypothetical protein